MWSVALDECKTQLRYISAIKHWIQFLLKEEFLAASFKAVLKKMLSSDAVGTSFTFTQELWLPRCDTKSEALLHHKLDWLRAPIKQTGLSVFFF